MNVLLSFLNSIKKIKRGKIMYYEKFKNTLRKEMLVRDMQKVGFQ